MVVSILSAVDPATNAATARVRIPNSNGTLKGGMFATARIIAGVHPNAFSVPATALVVTNNQPRIFVVGNDSKVKEVQIKQGWHDGGRIEIIGDVRAGETVVTTGSYGLEHGMSVKVKKVES
jgi:multidrug efflux pump subunit AcrA (membrane-fusion protein)